MLKTDTSAIMRAAGRMEAAREMKDGINCQMASSSGLLEDVEDGHQRDHESGR